MSSLLDAVSEANGRLPDHHDEFRFEFLSSGYSDAVTFADFTIWDSESEPGAEITADKLLERARDYVAALQSSLDQAK